MKKKRIKILRMAALIAAAIFMAGSDNVLAVDTVTLPLEVYGEDVISVVFPSVNEGDDLPFNFIMDPQGLLYKTGAVKYGGGSVEEGATLLFFNHEGKYNFSGHSDRLTIRNQSNIPVIVTITASISNLGEVEVVGSPDFGESQACSLYLALVDDKGNELPVSESGEISVSTEMRQAPDNAYAYWLDEETGSYTYELCGSPEEIDFDYYSFGLKGCCNPNGKWQNIDAQPSVQVTWKIEPVLSEDTDSEDTEGDADGKEDADIKEDIDAEENTDMEQTPDIEAGADHGTDTDTEKNTDITDSGTQIGTTENIDIPVQEGAQEPDTDIDVENQNPVSEDVEDQETDDREPPEDETGEQGEEDEDSSNDLEDVSANEIKVNMNDGEELWELN